MNKVDVATSLESMGLSQVDAQRASTDIHGGDYMRLVEFIGRGDQRSIRRLLVKYGITFGSRDMTEDSYLSARFESLRSGSAMDDTHDGAVTPLAEGFTFEVSVHADNRDRVLDYLDDHNIEYEASSPMAYRVFCDDRETTYRTGQAMKRILSLTSLRDAVEEAKRPSTSKRISQAKEKMASMTPPDPNKQDAMSRKNAGFHKDSDPRKVDKHGRGAKYKPRYDESSKSNELEPVSSGEVNKIDEGVIGMTKINPLYRLRELAGLSAGDDLESITIPEIPAPEPTGPLGPGPVAPEADPLAGDALPQEEPTVDATDALDAVDPLGDDGVPGELGAEPVEPLDPAMGTEISAPIDEPLADQLESVPTQSDAMSQIEDSLNGIQTMLADIRLSEYKSLIKKLQDLTTQAQMMGRDYLGERRKK